MVDRHIMGRLFNALCLLTVLGTTLAPAPLLPSVVQQTSSDRSSRIALLHTISISAHPIALAVDAPAGRVVVLSQGPGDPNNHDRSTGHASVSFLYAATGALARTTALGSVSYIGGPPNRAQGRVEPLAVDERTGHVFVLQHGKLTAAGEAGDVPVYGQVRLIDATTGRALRTVPAGPDLLTLILETRSGHLFVPSAFSSISNNGTGIPRGGSVQILSTETGSTVRTIPVIPSEYQDAPMVDARRGRILLRGRLRAGFGADAVIVIDAATGRVVRVVALTTSPNACSPSLVFDEGTNHFIEASGEARASMRAQVLDGNTGRVLRDEMLPSMAGAGGSCPVALATDASTARAFVYEAPAYTGGMSYVSVLDTRDGRIVSTVPTGFGESTSISLAIDHRAGSTFIVDTNTPDVTTTVNKLTVLDTRSGRVLHTMTLGQGPPIVAVDERTERLFVVNGADSTVSVLDISHQ